MPACTALYRCRLMQGKLFEDHAEIVRFEEEREPDEWGDPGRLISRRPVAVEAACEVSWLDRVRTGYWRFEIGERVGPVEWKA